MNQPQDPGTIRVKVTLLGASTIAIFASRTRLRILMATADVRTL